MQVDLDQFEERAAIAEFDGGLTRFDAETLAAREQGIERWQVMKLIREAQNAQRSGYTGGGRNTDAQMAREQRADDLSVMQPTPAKEDRSVSEHQPEAGRAGVVLPSLRDERRRAA